MERPWWLRVRSAVQLYTLRDASPTVQDRLATAADAGFDGVEFAGLGDADPEAVASTLDDASLDVAGAHVDVDDLEGDSEATIADYRTVGADALVVPYLDESCFAGRDAVESTADRLAALASTLDDDGLALCYHNHAHEFVEVDGTTAWEHLVAVSDPSVAFELDVGWARAAGRDPVALLDRYGDRVPLVHLKDVDADRDRPVDLGDGDVDLDGCVRAAADAGVDWLVYEHDDPDDPRASVRHAAEWFDDHV